ncbi:hypothetical protein W02_34580 [Nitrospira sp. KM1]|uniref:FmdB family zinc ribbon protein n=1 Tax=Nitrospira sp. KM1 TaxID=1936990 RepID=UPI0013A7183C|nr:zinc ribbon domain-containing protein [Nitrospira sp. KM1]BCA56318.1 hypothetical protein W02_34580 [Nitrospira sp. KM1]
MPIYEYRCGGCEKTFEATQSLHFRAEDTICPFCNAQDASRIISAVSSNVVGTRKPGFSEMKAYNMLNERMDKFKRLPPLGGMRNTPPPNITPSPDSSSSDPSKQ